MKKLLRNVSKEKIKNFLTIANAYAEQRRLLGEDFEFLSAANAPIVYEKLLKLSMAANDSRNTKHATATNAIREYFPNSFGAALETFSEIGESITSRVKSIAESFVKYGLTPENSVGEAFNTLAGNPNYDYYGNLNLLSGQLFEDMVFVQSFIDSGDAFNMPIDSMAAMSRFRSPTEQVTGSGKTYQGDINSSGMIQNDSSSIQVNLFNEFKNVKWLMSSVNLTGDQRDQILMYENSVAPAMAGFLIQQRLLDHSQKLLLKQAELLMVGGLDQANNYIPGVGGSYGLLSENILLTKSDAGEINPSPVSGAEWQSNPNKLVQKITNYWFEPPNVSAPLPIGDSALMYKELTRLFALPATINVDLQPKEWVLFVPSSWYAQAVQYPSSGTFNKQLQEMVTTATAGKIVGKVRVETSSLLNYDANIGTSKNPYNYMVLIAMGSPTEKKAVIMPGQTTIPTVVALPSSSALMSFQVKHAVGGAMVKQYGGMFVLEFSNAA